MGERRAGRKFATPRLDIGAGHGDDLLQHAGAERYAVECYPPNIAQLQAAGVAVVALDIERDMLPYPDRSFDVVIANQILEHTKELFWILSEVQRVLVPGGTFIMGVPKITALHNRLMLGIGLAPFTIKPLGPHVRGFVGGELRRFVETRGISASRSRCGAPTSTPFLQRSPGPGPALGGRGRMHVSVAERTDSSGRFMDVLDRHFVETNFWRGPPAMGNGEIVTEAE